MHLFPFAAFISFAVYENFGVRKFHRFIFKYGICALFKQEIVHDGFLKNVGEEGETEHSRYKIISSNEILFYYYENPFSLKLRMHTPLALKGSAVFEKGTCQISGKVFIFPTIFFAGWFCGITSISYIQFSKSNNFSPEFLGILFFMLIFPLAIIFFSMRIEKERTMKAWEEIRRRVL